jgi:hypothetical protein
MPSLTMQSIGVAGGMLVGAQHASATTRSAKAGAEAALRPNQNQVRAVASATEVKPAKERSVQAEKRAEGVFSDESSSEEGAASAEGSPRAHSGLNRVA